MASLTKKAMKEKPENNQNAGNKTVVSHCMEPHLPALELSIASFLDPAPRQLPQSTRLLLLRPQQVPTSALFLQIQAPDYARWDLGAPLPCPCSRLTVCRRCEGSHSQHSTASKGNNVPKPFHSWQLNLHQKWQLFLKLSRLCLLHDHSPPSCAMLELGMAEGPLYPWPAASGQG